MGITPSMFFYYCKSEEIKNNEFEISETEHEKNISFGEDPSLLVRTGEQTGEKEICSSLIKNVLENQEQNISQNNIALIWLSSFQESPEEKDLQIFIAKVQRKYYLHHTLNIYIIMYIQCLRLHGIVCTHIK